MTHSSPQPTAAVRERSGERKRSPQKLSRAEREAAAELKWLSECGWSGWVFDRLNGHITTHHGDTFDSSQRFRKRLMALEKWPRTRQGHRNVPKLPPLALTSRAGGEKGREV